MAKKQGPNLLGIHKQMLASGQDTRGASFVGGALKGFALNLAEEEKAEATMQQHIENLGGLQNINKVSPEQRGAITDFLKTNRDEYYNLATQYEKSKDPAIKDKMDAIKYSFQTLDSQLAQYATGKAEYLNDYEEGNLIGGEGFASENSFYTKMYGDPNAQFAIDKSTGEMSFTANGVTKGLKDMKGHTVRFYEGETAIDKYVQMGKTAKMTGANWMGAESVAKSFANAFRGRDRNDIKALMYTDLSGDESNLSFIEQFKAGTLEDKSFYNGITLQKDGTVSEEDVSKILNSKKTSIDLLGKFIGNVSDTSYNNASLNPDVKLKQDYQKLLNDQMRQKLNLENNPNKNGQQPLNKGFKIQNKYESKEVGNNIIYEIQNKGVARNPVDGMEYYWKGDGWYDGDDSKVADDTDQLTRDIFGIQDNRFNGLTPGTYTPTEDNTWENVYVGGDDKTSGNINKMYGLNQNKNIMLVPYTEMGDYKNRNPETIWDFGIEDSVFTNDMMAVNPITKEVYKGKDGKVARFMSRKSDRFTKDLARKELKQIQDLIRSAGINVPSASGPIVINNQQEGGN